MDRQNYDSNSKSKTAAMHASEQWKQWPRDYLYILAANPQKAPTQLHIQLSNIYMHIKNDLQFLHTKFFLFSGTLSVRIKHI